MRFVILFLLILFLYSCKNGYYIRESNGKKHYIKKFIIKKYETKIS